MTRTHGSALVVLVLAAACGPDTVIATTSAGEDELADSSSDSPETTQGTDADASSEEESAGLDIIPVPDQLPEPCEVLEQDCPEGEKCVPYYAGGWDLFKCVPVLGDAAPGESCTSTGPRGAMDDCDASSYCHRYGEDLVGTCYEFCSGTFDDLECPADLQCEWYFFVCIPTCDPLAQDCPPGTACYWDLNQFSCNPSSSAIPTGEPCGSLYTCAPGHLCVSVDYLAECAGSACCAPFCELGVGDCASLPGTSCVPFFEEGVTPEGFEDVGLCIFEQP